MPDPLTIVGAVGTILAPLITAVGGVFVGHRRGRAVEHQVAVKQAQVVLQDRTQLDSSTGALLDRLERDVTRLDGLLDEERERGNRCEAAHRECTETTDQLRRRLTTLEERVETEISSGDSTPRSPPTREDT